MSAHDDYLDPDRHGDQGNAFGIKIDDVWWAWDEDGNVYRQDPTSPAARDDGYVWVGMLDMPDDPEAKPVSVLREFAKGIKPIKPIKPMRMLQAFQRGDGAHWGLSDWYEDGCKELEEALAAGEPFDTGWYSSKKEIASARIHSVDGKTVQIEASVSDDFDTPGHGERTGVMPLTLGDIAALVSDAWNDAAEDQKDNRDYEGFAILHEGAWGETYLVPVGDAGDTPSGDHYYWWGWQHEEVDGVGMPPPEMPAEVVKAFEQHANALNTEPLTLQGWTIKPWSDS